MRWYASNLYWSYSNCITFKNACTADTWEYHWFLFINFRIFCSYWDPMRSQTCAIGIHKVVILTKHTRNVLNFYGTTKLKITQSTPCDCNSIRFLHRNNCRNLLNRIGFPNPDILPRSSSHMYTNCLFLRNYLSRFDHFQFHYIINIQKVAVSRII